MVYLTYRGIYPLLDKINFHCYEQESFVLLSAFYNFYHKKSCKSIWSIES